jgi:hypothetical protein
VPPGQPGDGKVPAIAWREYQTRLPIEQEIRAWFGAGEMNIAVITGAVSGFVVIDADARDALRWLTQRLPYTPWQTQMAGGFHLWYRCPDIRVANRARIETHDKKLKIDVRGDGGFVIAPGSLHASGAVYLEAGNWSEPRERVPVENDLIAAIVERLALTLVERDEWVDHWIVDQAAPFVNAGAAARMRRDHG